MEAWLVASGAEEADGDRGEGVGMGGVAARPACEAQTLPHGGGGVTPAWSNIQQNSLALVPEKDDGVRLVVKNSNVFFDDVIGACLCHVRMDLIGAGFSIEEPIDQQVSLTLRAGGDGAGNEDERQSSGEGGGEGGAEVGTLTCTFSKISQAQAQAQ